MSHSLQQAVWQIVASIPAGRVASYGQVARLAGFPGYARHVGRVLKELPPGSRLPWHRVLLANGRLAFAADSQAWRRQRKSLEAEGITFEGDRVPLARFQWRT